MGDSVHAPTIALAVPSGSAGPANGAHTNGNTAHKSLFDLMAARDRVMAELSALGSVLESHNVDMNTPLVTPDGFPRADIDVAQIRTTRAKIIRLKNDYKGYMDSIEKGLHQHHARLAADQSPGTEAPTANGDALPSGTGPSPASRARVPFARVNSIADSSPAADAGLKVGDTILQFGDVDGTFRHDNLRHLARVVGDNEGQQIVVKIRRALQDMELLLTPRSGWGGRGSLGCHLLPI